MVKLSLLQHWYENNTLKTITTKADVDAILDLITREAVPMSYETGSAEYAYIRIEQVVKDKNYTFPLNQSGGSLCWEKPATQIGQMRYNVLSGIPDIKSKDVKYNDPSITLDTTSNNVNLIINTSCEF